MKSYFLSNTFLWVIYGLTGFFVALELKAINEILQFIVLILTIIGLSLGTYFKIKSSRTSARYGRKHNTKSKDI